MQILSVNKYIEIIGYALKNVERKTSDGHIKAEASIEQAEMEDVRPLLGDAFYFDILKNLENYKEITLPHEFTYKGNTHQHKGLKTVIAYFAFANYVVDSAYTPTPHGTVVKRINESEKSEIDYNRNISNKYYKMAQAHFRDLALYLNSHAHLYPLWVLNGCGSGNRGKFLFKKVTNRE